MKINGKTITASYFAYDGCHKIYLIESKEDNKEAKRIGYTILGIDNLENTYNNSCSLRFINTWRLDSIVEQFEEAVFN